MNNSQIKSLKIVEFEGTELEIIDRNGTPWLRGGQIGDALGYKTRPGDAASQIYNRNKDEFTPDMTAVIDLPHQIDGGVKQVRIFSPRGCHLLAMFARTPKAKAFRRWVLDVLEGHIQNRHKSEKNHLTDLQKALLDRAPSWQKILHYLELGLNTYEIARLIYCSPINVLESLCHMERCGLLPPDTVVRHGYTYNLKHIEIIAQKRTGHVQLGN